MKSIVKTAPTVDEAVNAALGELDCKLEDVNIEILQQPKGGFLGLFGGQDAVVRISLKAKDSFDQLLEDENIRPKSGEREPSPAPSAFKDQKADRAEARRPEKLSHQEPAQPFPKKSSGQPDQQPKHGRRVGRDDSLAQEQGGQDKREEKKKKEKPKKAGLVQASSPFQPYEKPEGKQKPKVNGGKRVGHEEAGEKEEKRIRTAAADRKRWQEPAAPAPQPKKEEKKPAPTYSWELEFEEEPVDEKEAEMAEAFIQSWLSRILQDMQLEAKVVAKRKASSIFLEIKEISSSDTGIAIGRRGESLNALQYLADITVNRAFSSHYRVFIDVGNYRRKRESKIHDLALRKAEEVRESQGSVALEAMNAYERRVVHTALQNIQHISTYSRGKEPNRRVVIRYEK